MSHVETRIEGVVLDEGVTVTFAELTRICGLNGRALQTLVVEGVLRPRGVAPEEWRFDGVQVRRARRALRLRRDLELNLAGTALALDLIDELERLRERIRLLERQAGAWD